MSPSVTIVCAGPHWLPSNRENCRVPPGLSRVIQLIMSSTPGPDERRGPSAPAPDGTVSGIGFVNSGGWAGSAHADRIAVAKRRLTTARLMASLCILRSVNDAN